MNTNQEFSVAPKYSLFHKRNIPGYILVSANKTLIRNRKFGLPFRTRGPVSLRKTCRISLNFFPGGRMLGKKEGSVWDWPPSSA